MKTKELKVLCYIGILLVWSMYQVTIIETVYKCHDYNIMIEETNFFNYFGGVSFTLLGLLLLYCGIKGVYKYVKSLADR